MEIFRCPNCQKMLPGWPPVTECSNCGNTIPTQGSIRLFTDAPVVETRGDCNYVGYDKVAEGYDQYCHPPELQKQLFSSYADKLLTIIKGDTILDLGCGPGHYAVELAKRGMRVVAGDISLDMLTCLESHLPDNGTNSTLPCRINAYDLPLMNESIDAVLGLCFLHCAKDPIDVAKEVKRVLRPGGLFITTNTNSTISEGLSLPLTEYYKEELQRAGAPEASYLHWNTDSPNEAPKKIFGDAEIVWIKPVSYSYEAGWDLKRLEARYTRFQIDIPDDIHDQAINTVQDRITKEFGINWEKQIIKCTRKCSVAVFKK